MSEPTKTNDAKSQHDPGPDTPRRPGLPGEQDQQRPGPSPDSRHPTGPSAPYDSDSGAVAERIRQDAAGQYGEGYPEPDTDGLSGGNGKGRDGSQTAQE
jgi:hypothetical protein